MRSCWLKVVPNRFLRAPIPIVQSEEGLKIPNQQEHDGKSFSEFLLMNSLHIDSLQNIEKLPYDFYCPTVKLEVEQRTCTCNIYFCSKKAVKINQRIHSRVKSTQSHSPLDKESDDTSEFDRIEDISVDEFSAPLVTLEKNMKSSWVEDE